MAYPMFATEGAAVQREDRPEETHQVDVWAEPYAA